MCVARCTLISRKAVQALLGKSKAPGVERAEKLMVAARALANSTESDADIGRRRDKLAVAAG